MDNTQHNKLVSFIWSIADDCLRDVYVRGKYRDVILPMFVLRRLDCLLEPTKEAVLEEVRWQREEAGFTDLDAQGLRDASGYVFYNTSIWTLKKLVASAVNNRQILEANMAAYLDGFSDNVKEIVERFDLRNQIRKLVGADVLLDVLEKFTDPYVNLSAAETTDPDGRKLPALSNLGMGYVFEELIRKFNEENNEEAGEHFTPREVIHLMTHLVFEPVRHALPPVITIYDGACGSGGMLTEAQNYLVDPSGEYGPLEAALPEGETAGDALPRRGADAIHLYGKEVNGETYAICKSDMMIKGNDPSNIRFGSTLSTNEFAGLRFDFMLSNPPYGKSWKGEQKFIMDGKSVLDPRFEVQLTDFRGDLITVPAVPRSSDGQLLFLMDMVAHMKRPKDSPTGSRIASVHNGSSLFTGDAGSGESNIRRYLIENDWLEAIIQLPNNLFYNTGITTYIWLLSNRKPPERRDKVQLIDASNLYRKLRRNLGAKNCEFAPAHIAEITRLYREMPENEISRVFENEDFGYYKVTVERPLRLAAQVTPERVAGLRFVPAPALREVMAWVYGRWGDGVYAGLAGHEKEIEAYLEAEEITLAPRQRKLLLSVGTWTDQRELMRVAERLGEALGDGVWMAFNAFSAAVDEALKALAVKLSASEKKQVLDALSWRDKAAAPVVKKVHRLRGEALRAVLEALETEEASLSDYGYWPGERGGEWIEYEADSELRDTENVPLKDEVHGYFLREVRPHVEDAWIALDKTQIGYEISFNRYFYRHTPLRSLEEVTAEILALEAETEGLVKRLVSFRQQP